MQFLAIRVGWMKEYEGTTESDYLIGGGKNPEESRRGVEVCNFLVHSDGYVYGNVGVKKKDKSGHEVKLDITKLGADKGDDVISNITILFFGGKKFAGVDGNRLIGYYKNATVYRESQRLPINASIQKKNGLKHYRFKAKSEDVVLLAPSERTIPFSPKTQSQWCFSPANYLGLAERISKSSKSIASPSPNKTQVNTTVPHSQLIEVEKRAIELTIAHYEGFGYVNINSVESENCGYDLEIGKGKNKLCIEVKGRGEQSPDITLTPNEYKYYKKADKSYRLVIVTGCLTNNPQIFICGFNNKELVVTNNEKMVVEGTPVQSYRIRIK